ncbi:MAG: heme-dependent peroxidase [Deltaproteobacteria bacterium]|nr:heme-dependent peroxidase [Deltaproteobacteria bacterium]
MKNDRPSVSGGRDTSNPAPNTLEGFAILHQFFRLKRREWAMHSANERTQVLAQASSIFAAMEDREDGQSALFTELGHKGDLLVIHFRRGFDYLAEAERELAESALSEFLEQSGSYLSVIEIGLYESTVKLHSELLGRGFTPDSPQWREAVATEMAEQRNRLASRLWPKIPDRRYVCFYPMNKRRIGTDNWYMLPLEERQRLMHDHGMIGRRYGGQVNQIISGSIGFDDWEWGVDLFADDPLVFKKLVYEMRFDESSARYAEFGPFHFGIRLMPSELGRLLGTKADRAT